VDADRGENERTRPLVVVVLHLLRRGDSTELTRPGNKLALALPLERGVYVSLSAAELSDLILDRQEPEDETNPMRC
jgi:hypothetical protein